MHFVISFGFRVTLGQQANTAVVESKVKTKHKQKESLDKKVEVGSDKTVKSELPEKGIIPTYVITELRIEYEPVPLYHFACDCKIWENLTEVSHNGRTRYLRNVSSSTSDDSRWVVFSIHHSTELNENQLKRFFDHKINFRITHGRNASKSKDGKAKQFEIRGECEDAEPDAFFEMHPINSPDSDKQSIPAPVTVKDAQNADFAVVSYVDPVPDNIHAHKFRNMLKTGNLPPQIVNVDQQISAVETKGAKKGSGKEARSKTDKTKARSKANSQIVIDGETLFSKMGTLTRYDNSPDIPGLSSLLLYVQCEDILPNKALRTKFSPLSINLNKLQNLPCDVLLERGFLYIRVKTTFMDRVIKSSYYNIEECIYFECIKTFLCAEFQAEELINFLVAGVLIVEVIGMRELSDDPEGFNKPANREEVLLGVAIFDLSELLRGSSEVKSSNSLCHPSVVYTANSDAAEAAPDEKGPISWRDSPLTQEVLALSGTSFQLRVRQLADLRPVHREILQSPRVLNRMLLILQDIDFARKTMDTVSLHNLTLHQRVECLNDNDESQDKGLGEDFITGFAIDCTNRVYIVLEGFSRGFLSTVWESVADLPTEAGYVYYNSECLFLTRLYEKFLSFNGLLKIQLSDTLERRLLEQSLYIGTSAKTPQSEVLRRLGLIKLTFTMRSLCQSRLLPDPEQLISFDKEKRNVL